MSTASSLECSPGERQARPAEVASAAEDFPQILYIMGTGRSGTTILEILLANNPQLAGVGEIKDIFRDGFLRNLPCSCGESGRRCKLWSGVLQKTGWREEDWVRMRRAVESLESHQRFPLVWAGLANGATAALYRNACEGLFRAVSAQTGRKIIVDSSKYAGRALLLSRMFPGRVKVLCVTRSAQGILQAFRRKNDDEQRPKSALAAAAYYLYVLFCMRLVRRRLGPACFSIRFEDLNRDPVGALEAIEDWSGYSLAASRARLAAGEWFDVGHIVTGNRLRKKGRVKFEPTASAPPCERGVGLRLLESFLESYRRLLGF